MVPDGGPSPAERKSVLRPAPLQPCFSSLAMLQTVGLTSASNSAFLTALYVIIVPLMLRRFDGRVLTATAIATVGLWFLVKPRATMNLGDVMTIGCAVAFAGHIVCLERYAAIRRAEFAPVADGRDDVAVSSCSWPGSRLPRKRFAPSAALLTGLAVTGVFATGAFAVQMWAQQLIPAQQVALILPPSRPMPLGCHGTFRRDLDVQGWKRHDPDSGADRCVGVTFSRTCGDDGTGLTTRSAMAGKFGNGRGTGRVSG